MGALVYKLQILPLPAVLSSGEEEIFLNVAIKMPSNKAYVCYAFYFSKWIANRRLKYGYRQ